MGISVEELLDIPFSSRTWNDKLQIVTEGKPRPLLSLSAVTVRQADGQVVRAQHYDNTVYDRVPWLTRCAKRRSFFCWPCLLFMRGKIWSESGVSERQFLIEGMVSHESCSDHIQAMLDLEIFIKQNLKSQNVRLENRRQQHNELVKKNREILKRLIDVIYYSVSKRQPPKRNSGCNQLNVEDCINVLQFLRNYDIQYVDHIDEAIAILNVHGNFLSDLVDAMTSFMKSVFKKETQQSTYVSLILSEHSDIAYKSQLSTILRYIKDGKICERFTGFTNKAKTKSADVFLRHISYIVGEFGIKERFVAHSIDGAILPTTALSDAIMMLKAEYPYSFFVPYHSHGLDYVIQQSLSHIHECELLFKILNEIDNYFHKNSKRWKEFEQFMFKKMPYLENTKWFNRSQLTKVVNTYRKYFIEFFVSAEENCKVADEEDIIKAHGFKLFLEDFETVFLLRLLGRLFEITAFENTLLKGQVPENAFDLAAVEQLKRNLKKEQETGFEKIWLHVLVENMKEDDTIAKKKRKTTFPKTYIYRELYNKIMTRTIQEIEIRFNSIHLLEFCHLLNYEKCVDERSANDFLSKLKTVHGPYFDEEDVKNELIVLRRNDLSHKSVEDLLQFFLKMNLKPTFQYLYKLAELILSLPLRRDSTATPKLKQLKNWCYAYEDFVVPGDISMLCVELDFLQQLKKTSNFQDEVIMKFNEMTNYMELLYK